MKILMFVLVLLLVGCAPTEEPVPEPDPEPVTAWIRNGSTPRMDAVYYDYAANYNFLMHAPGSWAIYPDSYDELKARNPETKRGEYFSMHTSGPWLATATPGSYPHILWTIGEKYRVKTTTGGIAAFWRNYPMYNFLDPACRAEMIDAFDDHVRANRLDWGMLDYCSNALPDHRGDWPQDDYGDLDFDGDGIGYWDMNEEGYFIDLDERAAVRAAWFDYIKEAKEVLPADFKLIVNGNLGIFDPEFRDLLDGIYVEHFPHWFFGTETPNLQNALDPEYPRSLYHLTSKPGFYVFLGDPWPYSDWRDLTIEFPGCVAAFNENGNHLPPLN